MGEIYITVKIEENKFLNELSLIFYFNLKKGLKNID